MFTERELLVMSFALDRAASKIIEAHGESFFSHGEATLLCLKIHNVLRTMREAKVKGV